MKIKGLDKVLKKNSLLYNFQHIFHTGGFVFNLVTKKSHVPMLRLGNSPNFHFYVYKKLSKVNGRTLNDLKTRIPVFLHSDRRFRKYRNKAFSNIAATSHHVSRELSDTLTIDPPSIWKKIALESPLERKFLPTGLER